MVKLIDAYSPLGRSLDTSVSGSLEEARVGSVLRLAHRRTVGQDAPVTDVFKVYPELGDIPFGLTTIESTGETDHKPEHLKVVTYGTLIRATAIDFMFLLQQLPSYQARQQFIGSVKARLPRLEFNDGNMTIHALGSNQITNLHFADFSAAPDLRHLKQSLDHIQLAPFQIFFKPDGPSARQESLEVTLGVFILPSFPTIEATANRYRKVLSKRPARVKDLLSVVSPVVYIKNVE